jgi:hypothetical protein
MNPKNNVYDPDHVKINILHGHLPCIPFLKIPDFNIQDFI